MNTSSIPIWKIPRTEESDGPQPTGVTESNRTEGLSTQKQKLFFNYLQIIKKFFFSHSVLDPSVHSVLVAKMPAYVYN